MVIGFIGAGKVTATYGRHLINAGHRIKVSNSRGPETLGELIAQLGESAKAVSREDAIEADVVVLATNWLQAPKALEHLRWHGQILIDATNAFDRIPADRSIEGIQRSISALNGRNSIEIIASLAPGARVVKSFNNLPMVWINDFTKISPKEFCFYPEMIRPQKVWWSRSLRGSA